MRAALYLRKSTDEQADSIETQRANAERFAAARGWTIVAEHVDSGISRTEFAPARRRGWFELQGGASVRLFDVVLTRDVSRIGGEIFRAGVLVQDLLSTGAHLVTYVDGREITATNALECVTLGFQLFGSQGEVEGIRSRTREALATKARAGRVVGGAVYGYSNKPSDELVKDKRGAMRPAYVTRVPHPAQTAIIREIFTRYADGEGLRTIAAVLNARGVPSPRAGRRGIGTWAPSVLHAMLRRPLYVGRLEWGHVAKKYAGGTKTRTAQHEHELVVRDAPELRIIDAELWERVVARIEGAAHGERKGGPPARYMLSGLLRCASCGGALGVSNQKHGEENVRVYTCQNRRDRGAATCAAPPRRRVELVDASIVRWLADAVLTTERVDRIVAALRARLLERRAQTTGDVAAVEREVRKLSLQISNLTEALADARLDARAAIVDGIAERQTRRAKLLEQVAAARVTPLETRTALERIEAAVRLRIDDARALLAERGARARVLLGKLFPEGMKVERTPKGVIIEAVASLGGLLRDNPASPAGLTTLSRARIAAESSDFDLPDGRVGGRVAA